MEKIEYSNNYQNKKKKNNNGLRYLILILFIVLSFLVGAGAMYVYSYDNPKIITKDRVISQNTVTEEAMEDAIDKVYDSVLCIEVLNNNGDLLSTGTGFVYAKDDKYGYVLTNSHVVSNGTNIEATLSNEKKVKLTLLGTDTYMDLAVLKMDVKDVIKVASIGTSKNSKVGNTVFTVGSPMGSAYAGTVTKGILSGKDRLVESSKTTGLFKTETFIVKVIQTDAAISPGNSGGPLVNLAGDVIGINSLKLVNEQVEGMGFAIPIEDVMNYVDYLEEGKAIKRPVIGVQILDLTNKYLLYQNGINVDSSVKEGIVLVKVNEGSAKNAGLQDGDIITKVKSEKVSTVAQFKYEIYKYSVGEEIEVTYYRNGKEQKVKIKLDKAND